MLAKLWRPSWIDEQQSGPSTLIACLNRRFRFMRSKRFLKDGSEVLQMSTEALEVSSWLGTAWRNAKPSGALRRPLRLAWGRRVVETRWKFFRPYRELDPGLVTSRQICCSR